MKKKRDLMLDFTSLLDVIMILLFVVICGMNNSAIEANKKAESYGEELQNAKNEIIKSQAMVEELSESNDNLSEELAQYTINGEATNKDKAEAYGTAIENTTKVMLKCETGMDIETNNHKVTINVVAKGAGEDTTKASLKIIHDFNLSKDERDEFNSKQVTEFKNGLLEALGKVDSPLIWFMIEYEYGDENFSNADILIIKEAIDDLALELGISCQIEEIRE